MSTLPGMWNEALINRIFSITEVYAILGIVLVSKNNPDQFMWNFSPDGEYTTKSGYKVIKNLMSQDSSSGNFSFKAPFHYPSISNIWGLGVSNNVRHFLWQLASDSLPTQVNLIIRSIQIYDLCPICNCSMEEAVHLLFKCEVARHALMKCGLYVLNFSSNGWGNANLIYSFLNGLEKNRKEVVAMCLW